MPMTGIKPIVIPIFMITWKKMQEATQYPKILENLSFCLSAVE